ncbi:MAG: L-serine ammonia-lyase, iron-sulfur-dependent, subunit alpha [Armatimonadota bacterium]
MNATAISILNDVLGPVMRGPSSSHTAGSYHIARLARDLLGDEPRAATFTFDPDGSYFQVYRQQGSDLAFAAGLMGWDIADDRFDRALAHAAADGIEIAFEDRELPGADHPNCVQIAVASRRGRTLHAMAKSTGGGGIVLSSLEGWPVHLTGNAHVLALEGDASVEDEAREVMAGPGSAPAALERRTDADRVLLLRRGLEPVNPDDVARLDALPGVSQVWSARPLFFLKPGRPLFDNAGDMVALAERRGCSLGELALAYEAELLGKPAGEVAAEITRRYRIMGDSVSRGLDDDAVRMHLLRPSAAKVLRAEADGGVAVGGLHTRAAGRALAAMHTNCSGGVVCAAPTGGAAGVLPGVLVTLAEERGLSEAQAITALLAAGAIGLIVATRATFAAEVAGCQVEIGAAGAMAAAAVVETAGGSARQACDAAAIALQNAMGSVCDLVQGIVEIPCHTRNAAAASSAFVCADLVLGGYENDVPLDETIDAVRDAGAMLPPELRCTARGGLALAPSARNMQRLK